MSEINKQDEWNKDSRKTKKMNEEAKNHHSFFMINGPEYIVRNELVQGKYPSSSADPFGVTCNDVVHSVNKHYRWESVSSAEDVLRGETDQGKTSLVSSSFSRPVACCWFSAGAYDERARTRSKAGVDSYLEVSNNNVIHHKARSFRASLASLERSADTIPNNRLNETSHTRYTKVSFIPIRPKDIERGWRSHQRRDIPWNQRKDKKDLGDWNSRKQDELEERLEKEYEKKMKEEDLCVV